MNEMIGVIKLFAGTYAPRGWKLCDGSLLNISQYDALFSIIRNTYGGDSINTFALPNLNGRFALGGGNVEEFNFAVGSKAGNMEITISKQNLPNIENGFQYKVANTNANTAFPISDSSIAISGTLIGRDFSPILSFANGFAPDTKINSASITFSSENTPIDNMPPYLVLNYIICVEGIYPTKE